MLKIRGDLPIRNFFSQRIIIWLMRSFLLLVLLNLVAVTVSAQTDKAVAITYHSQAFLDVNEALPPYPDTTDMDAEEIEEELKIYEYFKAYALRNVTEANDASITSTYITYRSKVLYDRSSFELSEDEYRIGDLSERKAYTYRNKNGSPTLDSMWMHDEVENWEVTYQIDTFPEDRKEILGYDCYRMTILEHRTWTSEGYDEQQLYDLYVTPELPLPFRAVGVLWRPITELCALEIIHRYPKHPKSYSTMKAIKIKTDVSPEVLELPEMYRGLKE